MAHKITAIPSGVPKRSLQEWYRLVNKIYFDKNHKRSLEEIFVHFIEVSKPLSLAGAKGRKKDTDPKKYLAKSLGWFFALCGRAGVPNIEEMIWTKFPRCCPYCALEVHNSEKCKERNPENSEVNWLKLRSIGKQEIRPATLAEWQQMYQKIYPRNENSDHVMNVRRLHEEIGEISEAIRVIEIAPQYFVSEAPDVFSWLMGFANQFDYDDEIPSAHFGRELERQLHAEYPGVCNFCNHEICNCPKILEEALGRIAKEAPEAVFDRKRGLFTLEESMKFFAKAEKALQIGSIEVAFTEIEKKELLRDMGLILSKLAIVENVNPQILLGIAHISTSLEQLTKSESLSQARLDEILVEIKNMPSDTRSVFLNIIASGIYGGVTEGLKAMLVAPPS